MYINQVFELTMTLDSDKFHKILDKVFNRVCNLEESEEEYIDQSLASKGILVKFRDSQYKKKIKLIVSPRLVLNHDTPDPDKLIRKLDKRISEYFNYKYQMDDFNLSGMVLSADIDVGDRGNVSAYLKVLQRIGRVKGFSPSSYECFSGDSSFCLDGNSNGIKFLIYDLESTLTEQLKETSLKKSKSMIKDSKGILRAEVRLVKPKAIQSYIDAVSLADQIKDIIKKNERIFMDTFMHIVPFGAYYKKGRAEKIIWSEIEDIRLRRKMLQLLALIPQKKSVYLAQKAMNCRNIEKIMISFARINLSPVTISKRQEIKRLKCIYDYLVDET